MQSLTPQRKNALFSVIFAAFLWFMSWPVMAQEGQIAGDIAADMSVATQKLAANSVKASDKGASLPVKTGAGEYGAEPDASTNEANISQSTVSAKKTKAKKTVNTILLAEVDGDVQVKLDGEIISGANVHRSDKGGIYFDPEPIFTALNNSYKFDPETGVLTVIRSQDRAEMTLNAEDGLVSANGKGLGRLPHFGELSDNRVLLTANAIAVLTGTSAKYNKKNNEFEFKLDPRLKVATGFDIFVQDVPLENLNPSPRSVGSVLILPLLPIADALGHDVTVLEGGQAVKIKRAQDSAELILNLSTGLVALHGRPIGLVKDVAFIDGMNLLMPANAIEALTGTHVDIISGTNRVEITLDEALRGGAIPEARVDDVLKETPFTLESADFTIGLNTINRVNANFHTGRFNGRLRYEVQDLPDDPAELEPDWLALDYRHSSGIAGSLGDYSGDFREFDGVGARRIRGVSGVKITDKGNRWALAAGTPQTGSRQISKDQDRATFSGLVAGARFAHQDGWEAGLALRHDSLSDDQRAVLSAISGSLGRKKDRKLNWNASGDIGVFNGPTRHRALDANLNTNTRYEHNKTISVEAGLGYRGVEFTRNVLQQREQLRQEALANGDTLSDEDINLIEDNELEGQDTLNFQTSLRFTPDIDNDVLKNPALALRYSRIDNGVFSGKETGSVINTFSAGAGAGIGNTGLSVGADYISSHASFNHDAPSISTQQVNLRAQKSFKWVDLRGQYSHQTRSDSEEDFKRLAVTANLNLADRSLHLGKEARITASPVVSFTQNNGSNALRAGVYASATSGDVFGKKNKIDARLGLLQSVNDFGGDGSTSKFLTVSANRKVNVGKNILVGLGYRNDLNGNQRIGLEVKGQYYFNEPRRYTKTQEGRGVLKGQAFLDKNYDGEWQEDEPGAGAVIVRVQSAGLALRTDKNGFFTIQNIKEGLYELSVDGRSLPLGYGLSHTENFRATIKDGHISTLNIPIIQKGQIRGFTFIDANADGDYQKGETRLEGVYLRLGSQDTRLDDKGGAAETTSFGQFAFDDLIPGDYEITIHAKGGPGYEGGTVLPVRLEAGEQALAKIKVPLTPRERSEDCLLYTSDAADD